MVNLSKSKYCGLWQCPKIAWLKKYKPEALTIDSAAQARMDIGNEVGDLAMGLFGAYTDVTVKKEDGTLFLSAMIERTAAEMEQGTETICEASFVYNGLYCAVDLLRKDGDGWSIYEVKSSTDSTEDPKDAYIADIAYQKFVLEHCGVHVVGTYLIRLNHEYVFDGLLKLNELFSIDDVQTLLPTQEGMIEANIAIAERILNSPDEPEIDISVNCKKPYRCGFWDYCFRDIPKLSVFNLYRMQMKKSISYYHRGLITYEALYNSGEIKNETQLRQIKFALYDCQPYIDKEKIREFLSTLRYPLFFLDFETIQPAIPQFIGTHPYQQIPTQYSLHYIEHEGGELKHKEAIGRSGTDTRRYIAERLCEDIPMGVCITAYNKSFECGRISELADAFPDLSEHLLTIRDNVIDLIEPFRNGWYYTREMGGSFSIKSVLPALFPNDPALDYHMLEGVHNGAEAMSVFPKICKMSSEEQEQAYHNLLKYCELDTFAMVKVWEKLCEDSK